MPVEVKHLPESVVTGMQYFREVLVPQGRLGEFEGRHIAVLESVLDQDRDPFQLARRVHERFPGTILYKPHAVELSPALPVSDDPELPDHLFEAQAYYEQYLRTDASWVQRRLHSHVAILGREEVDVGIDLGELLMEVRAIYGNDPMFITQVTEEYSDTTNIGLHAATHSDLSQLADR